MKISLGLLTVIFVIALLVILFFGSIAYRHLESPDANIYLFVIVFVTLVILISFFKISQDNIELKKANKRTFLTNRELSKQNDIFNHTEETSHIGSFVWDLQTGEIKYSVNLYQMLGYSADEFTPTFENFLKLIHPDDKVRAEKESTGIFKNGAFFPTTYRVYRKDGQLRHFNASGKFIILENHRLLIGTFQDITDTVIKSRQFVTKNAELKISEDRYHLMISEVQDYAIILLDVNGIIQNWNKGAEKIKGYKEEEIIGKSFSVFYPKEDLLRKLPDQLLEEARKNGRAAHGGWRVRNDGTRFWGNVVITALHDEHDNVIGFTKVTRDLTVQKEAEERLMEYNRNIERKNVELQAINEEIASFNHIASHDLQEPLRKIQTFISRIEKMDFDLLTEKGKEYFIRINTSANRMQHLIDDLITFTHTNKGDKVFVPTDIHELCLTVVDEMKPTIEEKKADITVEKLPTINVIPFQFAQLFTNLIDNSLKYQKANVSPIINISSSVVPFDQVPGALESGPKNFHRIIISDNGIGFEQQYAETIFILFQRLHDKAQFSGTGIGLAICKKIVENHNGFIMAESIPDAGSQFYIFIPAES